MAQANRRPTGPKPKPLADRFWPKVAKAGPDDCWLWCAGKNRDGYGNFSLSGGHSALAHRASWFLAHGTWPDLQVLHRCDTPCCVNPAHLFLGTQQENMQDMFKKGRDSRGERHPISKLSDEQVTAIRIAVTKKTKDLAIQFGISESQVLRIRNGTSWRHSMAEAA